jgi:hypothetical protein
MKTRTLLGIGILAMSFFGLTAFAPKSKAVTTNLPGEYSVQMVSNTQVGEGYEWIWTVTNPNPGNGTNGTIQNLSHWSIAVANTITVQNVIGVAYSTDGITWHNLTPSVAVDKSNDCAIGTQLKFDYGTTGGEPTYYRLILDTDFAEDGTSIANFKSGSRTGCYTSSVSGPSLAGTIR